MKKQLLLCFACMLLLAVTQLAAQKATLVYVEGVAHIQNSSGARREADFGGSLTYGESVITGRDGLAELRLENGSTIRVAQNTVFNYSSVGTGSSARPVLATTAGSVTYKLARSTGQGPVIQTNSAVAGVRGTEFTVFAGRDGAVMLAVIEGVVDIEAQGETVTLYANEAVDVEPGKAPGEKIVWLGKELDFSSWNTGRMDEFFADPVAGIKALNRQLEQLQAELNALKPLYEQSTGQFEQVRAAYRDVLAAGDSAAITAFQNEQLFPAQDNRARIILNLRYWALNYLGVRRYCLSNMYMELKSRYPLQQPEHIKEFFRIHSAILEDYESFIVPELNSNDY